MFVGGLSSDTSEIDMQNYFAQYGTVVNSIVKIDQNTNRSRGFGFITFEQTGCIDKVLAVPDHYLKGKRIDPKRIESNPGSNITKVFIGGIDANYPEDQLRTQFIKYGKVCVLFWPFPQGFGGIYYELFMRNFTGLLTLFLISYLFRKKKQIEGKGLLCGVLYVRLQHFFSFSFYTDRQNRLADDWR